MGKVSKYIVNEMAKNMPKNDSKIVDQKVFFTTEEVYLDLENKADDSDYVYSTGVYIIVHKDGDKKVTSVEIQGFYNPKEWKDISKFIQSIS